MTLQLNYRYLGIALTIMVIASFSSIIPLWGWWELGRKVSLNPVETAKAFNVSGLRVADFGSGADDIVKAVGNLRVRYVPVQVCDSDGGMVPRMELRALASHE